MHGAPESDCHNMRSVACLQFEQNSAHIQLDGLLRNTALAHRSAEKTEARVEERERRGRSLHDNLLQGVQGLILSCHAILMRMPTGTPEERQPGQALASADMMIEGIP